MNLVGEKFGIKKIQNSLTEGESIESIGIILS
jgi:hypothetical protein